MSMNGYDELKWVGPGTRKALTLKVGTINVYVHGEYCLGCVIMFCMCQCIIPWRSLGEAFRVALQWSGRNSMAPVSGCSWWCPICITR